MPYYGMYRDLVDEVVAIDWPGSVHNMIHVDVLADLNRGIPLASESVETIFCVDVLEHIFRPDAFWGEIGRLLKAGGRAIIGVPFLYWIHEEPHDHHRYTRFALARYASENGLRVLDIRPVGGLPHVLADLLGKVFDRVPLVPETVGRMADLTGKAPFLRGPAGKTAAKFPLAYVLVAEKSAAAAPGADPG